MKVSVKFGGSRSNRSRHTRLPHFVMNDDDDTGVARSLHKAKHRNALCLKTIIHTHTQHKVRHFGSARGHTRRSPLFVCCCLFVYLSVMQ